MSGIVERFTSFYRPVLYGPSPSSSEKEGILITDNNEVFCGENLSKLEGALGPVGSMFADAVQTEVSTPKKYIDCVRSAGFQTLSGSNLSNVSYKIISQDQLPKVILKFSLTYEGCMTRVVMANRIRALKIPGVLVPEKRVIEKEVLGSDCSSVVHIFFAVCQKMDVLSREETIAKITTMNEREQIEIARKICKVMEKTGLHDCHFDNIRLDNNNNLVFLDTEPHHAFASTGSEPMPLMQCAKEGCNVVIRDLRRVHSNLDAKNSPFVQEVEAQREQLRDPVSKKLVILSILTLGLLPLFYLIKAYLAPTKVDLQNTVNPADASGRLRRFVA